MFRVAKKMSSTNQLATAFLLLTVATAATALKCWRCGQYSDGIGSITPCTNRSAARVVECPSNAKYCIRLRRIIKLLDSEGKLTYALKNCSPALMPCSEVL
ncbi:uncharacterized protein [Choristoneura fumiferana]|uniref:uncharacterized protein n=1 Tax=Choristoneura fumiferana TaxID=7141 RepID=UPI003D15A01B